MYGVKPKTKPEYDQFLVSNKDLGYGIESKENQIITTSDGVTHIGTLTKFENEGGHRFYYFTPYTNDRIFSAGLYYEIADKQGSTAITSNNSVSGSTSSNVSTSTLTSNFQNDIYGFAISGYSYVANLTTPSGTPVWVSISPNVSPVTVISVLDPNASKIVGKSRDDAKHLQDDILNVLNKSTKFDKFKALLKRGPNDNKAFFSKIPQDKLDEALNDLDSGDQKVFATIVANTINSDKSMVIQYFTVDTLLKTSTGVVSTDYNLILDSFLPKLPIKLINAFLYSGAGITSTNLLMLFGGGATVKTTDGIISVLDTTNKNYDEVTALHEFFGHGRPLSTETANTKHDKGDAIRFENLVWRLLGKPNNQRDGSDHGDQNGVPMTDSKDLPKFN